MKILVFGAGGQLGCSLRDTEPANWQVEYIARSACDLSEAGQVRACLNHHVPDVVINAAAYTAVDRAEEESALAHRINADAVGEMAEWIAGHPGARLLQVSTDFVFDGSKTTPYLPGDETGPVSTYGESKLAGELAALRAAPEQTIIVRTAWVYSEHGANFVKTMLRLMAERPELNVVADQRGSPTYARHLAEVLWLILAAGEMSPGIYHWTDQGNISWHQFAEGIQEAAVDAGLLENTIPVNAITTDEYPTPAERPAYSVLDTRKLAAALGIDPVDWRQNLAHMLQRMR